MGQNSSTPETSYSLSQADHTIPARYTDSDRDCDRDRDSYQGETAPLNSLFVGAGHNDYGSHRELIQGLLGAFPLSNQPHRSISKVLVIMGTTQFLQLLQLLQPRFINEIRVHEPT
jgi:hypothetical protein